MPLTSRYAVLNNIEVAWNQRESAKVDELLDDNFAFYFAPGDVGGSIPAYWNRADELATTTALFTSNSVPPANGPVCSSMRLDLQLDNVIWAEVPDTVLDETRYATTIFYTFTFEMEPATTYIAQTGAKAQFTVRNALQGGNDHWQLVEWRDLGNSLVTGSRQIAATSEATWGSIKALYRD